MLALTTEALLKVLLSDEASVVNVEVMEGEEQVLLSDGLSAIDCHGKELSVVDLAVMIEVDSLEDLVNLLLAHVELVEGCLDFIHLKRS